MLVSVLIIGSLVQSAAVPLQEHTIRYGIQLLQAFKNNINMHHLYNLGKTGCPKWKGVSNMQKCPQALKRYGSIINRNELQAQAGLGVPHLGKKWESKILMLTPSGKALPPVMPCSQAVVYLSATIPRIFLEEGDEGGGEFHDEEI